MGKEEFGTRKQLVVGNSSKSTKPIRKAWFDDSADKAELAKKEELERVTEVCIDEGIYGADLAYFLHKWEKED